MVFRHLLQSWLRTEAQRKVREKVVEAAQEQLQATADKPPSEPPPREPPPCNLGVIFALGIEAGGLEDRLEGVISTRGHGFSARQGSLGGRHLTVILSGPGRRNAAGATEALITGHNPPLVISAGFAGGLSPELKRHEILVADHLVDLTGNRLAIDHKLAPGVPPVKVGPLLTADRVIRLPDEKRSLLRRYDALAVDMETSAVADVCRRRQIPFLAVRVINDAVDDELPPDVEKLLAQKTRTAQLGAAAGAIWKRPSSIKDIYRLKENALLASDRLAEFLAAFVKHSIPK